MTGSDAQVETLRARYASRFGVPDGGRYLNDWTDRVDDVLAEVDALAAQLAETREALRGVANAYGCFAGCTGALPGAPTDGSGHTPACAAARALAAQEGDTDG